jgi:hypothetical protein
MNRILLCLLCACAVSAQVSVTTSRNDGSRTGWNPHEVALNNSNVNPAGFGKLYSYQVDASVYTQPLYLQNVAIPNQGAHNVLFVSTMNDTVYAFDADKNQQLWSVNFTNPSQGVTAVPIADITGSNDLNIVGTVGIEGTPVIDPATLTMYLVARTKEVTGSGANYVQRLHALDVTTGAEKFGGPVVIQASVPGNGEESLNGKVSFDPFWQNQRTGLALANGQVIIAWSSHEDDLPYHGWILAYSAATLQQTGAFNDTPNGQQGGIWMSGRAPVVDSAGNVYVMTGNGSTDNSNDYSECVLRLSSANNTLTLKDYFQTDNSVNLNQNDEDLGSSGPLLIPGANALVGGGKQGRFYVLNPSNLGHYASGDKQIPQEFQAVNNAIFPGPAFYQSSSLGAMVYLWTMGDSLKGFQFVSGKFHLTPAVQSTVQSAGGYDPGGALSVSSHHSIDSTAIVWAALPDQDADHGLSTGSLHALNAATGAELWSTAGNANNTAGPFFAKFVPPTIANGKVYLATFTDYTQPAFVHVYGLLKKSAKFTMTVSPSSEAANPGAAASYTVSVNPEPGYRFSGTVTLSVAGLPAGVTGAFNPPSITGAGVSTLTLTIPANAVLGTSTLTLKGSASPIVQTAKVSLMITKSVGSVNINFVGNGQPLSPADIAGVVPKANWNNLTASASTTPVYLTDDTGTVTPVNITWAANNPWALGIPPNNPNWVMMNGYLDDGNAGSITVTVSGMPAAPNGYSVYVYANGDGNGATRNATYTIGTTTIALSDAAGNVFNGAFQQVTAANPVGNYMIFPLSGTSFTLVSTPVSASDGTLRAPVNGIQIVAN